MITRLLDDREPKKALAICHGRKRLYSNILRDWRGKRNEVLCLLPIIPLPDYSNSGLRGWSTMIARPSLSALIEMFRPARNNRHHARPRDLRLAVNRDLQFALDYLVNLFLGMIMLVDRGAAHKLIMRECHVLRMEIAPLPARQAFYHL